MHIFRICLVAIRCVKYRKKLETVCPRCLQKFSGAGTEKNSSALVVQRDVTYSQQIATVHSFPSLFAGDMLCPFRPLMLHLLIKRLSLEEISFLPFFTVPVRKKKIAAKFSEHTETEE